MAYDPDRLSESPPPARVCDSCSELFIGPRCGGCGWVLPDDDEADDPDATDVLPREGLPVYDDED